MEDDSRPLPADVIATVARQMARRHRTIAVTLFVVAGLAALFTLIPFLDPHTKWPNSDHPPVLGGVLLFALLGGIPAVLGFRRLFAVRHANRVGRRARGTSLEWFLTRTLIVAADERRAPLPELTLKITKTLRQTLTAVPRATAVMK